MVSKIPRRSARLFRIAALGKKPKKSDNVSMKKGDGPNPGVEFLYKLYGEQGFRQDIIGARKHLGIPEGGFIEDGMDEKWMKDNHIFDLMAVESYLQKKYKISIAYIWQLSDYIFFGEIRNKANMKIPPSVVIEKYAHRKDIGLGDVEEFYKETAEPYVKLYILGNASKSDILGFINKNWKEIEDVLVEQRGERRMIRTTTYKGRNQLIKELICKSIEELQKEAESHSRYKDLLIQKILLKRGFGAVNEGYIRKMGSKK